MIVVDGIYDREGGIQLISYLIVNTVCKSCMHP